MQLQFSPFPTKSILMFELLYRYMSLDLMVGEHKKKIYWSMHICAQVQIVYNFSS